MNQALPRSRGELVLLLDADSLVEEGAIKGMVALLEEPGVVGVAGVPYPLNHSDGTLPKLFALECRLWELISSAKDRFGLFVQAPGFCSLLRRESIELAGGWDEDSLAEDNDLSARLFAMGGRIRLAPVKVGVEAPARLRTLVRQRFRWYRGTVDVFRRRFTEIARLPLAKKLDLALTLLSPVGVALFLPAAALALVVRGALLAAVTALLLLLLCASALVARRLPLGLKAKLLALAVPYLALQSAIAWAAVLSMLLPIKVRWVKTEKSGTYAAIDGSLG